jgi:GAF domain
LEDLLTRVATYAVQAIPGADGAGLTLLEQDRADTIVATAPFVTEVDEIQYGMNHGPCISAAREAQTVVSGSLGGDPRWPRFGGRVARLGVHSVVSLPLITPDRVVGAMNVYARAKNTFNDRAAQLARSSRRQPQSPYRTPMSSHRPDGGWQTSCSRRWNFAASSTELLGSLSRSGSTEHEALERLRSMSQWEHRKLAEVARRFVDEAVARARARNRQSREPS